MSAVVLAASAASSSVEAAPAGPLPSAKPDSSVGVDGDTPPRASFPLIEQTLTSARFVGAMPLPTGVTGGIPATVLAAYQRGAERTNMVQPGCHIPYELLAAIGKVESGHARGGRVDAAGTTATPILGPVLNGGPFAAIADTDGGRLDGDAVWDRAVGPMQFIPSTWARWASDGNVDGRPDPHNIFDASLAAARYLCAANRDIGTPGGLDEAVLSYNHSTSYLSLVRSWMTVYQNGTISVDGLIDPGFDPIPVGDPVAVAGPAAGSGAGPGSPSAAPVTPPAAVPPTTALPMTPAPPPTPPVTPPPTIEPPVTEPPTTEPPTTEPPASEPPSTEPSAPAPPTEEPADQCGLVDAVTGLVGGLLGEDPSCVQPLELSTPETTTAVPAP